MRMSVTKRERAIVEAARDVQRLQDKRLKLKTQYTERLKKLEGAFAEQIIVIDREIQAAKEALRTFTDGGVETVAEPELETVR
jgi:hypothetical protein